MYSISHYSLLLHLIADLFYMKTCSFRGAEPRSINEGLICDYEAPEVVYRMTPCGDPSCLCCYPCNIDKRNQSWPVIDFASSGVHRFVNGYTTYLNCSAVCCSSS